MKIVYLIAIVVILGAGLYMTNQNMKEQELSLKQVTQSDSIKSTLEKTEDNKHQAEHLGEHFVKDVNNTKLELASQTEVVASKVKELVVKAKDFLNDGKYEEAMKVAQNILSNFDSESTEAKGIIEQAKIKVKEAAQAKLEIAQKDLVNKIPSFGQ